MLVRKTNKFKIGKYTIITRPFFFRNFNEEIYEPCLYNDETPILEIRLNDEILYMRKQNFNYTYEFVEEFKESISLDEVLKRTKTLTELKLIFAGLHPKINLKKFNNVPIEELTRLDKRHMFVEYVKTTDGKMIKKNDNNRFEPFNLNRFTEEKIEEYLCSYRTLKITDIKDLMRDKRILVLPDFSIKPSYRNKSFPYDISFRLYLKTDKLDEDNLNKKLKMYNKFIYRQIYGERKEPYFNFGTTGLEETGQLIEITDNIQKNTINIISGYNFFNGKKVVNIGNNIYSGGNYFELDDDGKIRLYVSGEVWCLSFKNSKELFKEGFFKFL